MTDGLMLVEIIVFWVSHTVYFKCEQPWLLDICDGLELHSSFLDVYLSQVLYDACSKCFMIITKDYWLYSKSVPPWHGYITCGTNANPPTMRIVCLFSSLFGVARYEFEDKFLSRWRELIKNI